MPEDIGLFDAIYSQRAIRQYKPDPVPDDLIHKVIEAGTKAPSGGNRQTWAFLIIRDADLKRRIGQYYYRAWETAYGAQAAATSSIQERVRASASNLAERMHEVPVLILACIQHDGSPSTMGRGASIYPSVQNMLLAARALGLGSVLTTLHKRYEQEVRDLLGIPESVETAALLPLGWPAEGNPYGPTTRTPVEEVTYYDTWGKTSS